MAKFWKYEDKDAYQRRKAGDILKKYPTGPPAEPVPERAPRQPIAPLGPQPAPVQPRPSLLRPSTWPTTTGIPAGVGIAQTPWMQALMGAVGGPEAAERAEPAVAWQRWLSSLTRERVAQPLAGELTMGGPLRAVFDPKERQALAANWRDVLAGRRTYGEVVGERAATARQAWQEAPVPGVARAATETLLDPLGVGGAMVAAPLMGAGGLVGALGKAYMAVDIADMAAYVASATPEELAGMVLMIGGVKAIGLAGKAIAVGVPALRKLLASEVGAMVPEGFVPEGKQRALASDVQELTVDQINIDPRKYQKRAIGKEGIGYREDRVQQILERWDPALMTPVKVRRMPDGTFDLLGGHHRMEVLRRKGIGTVTAQIFDVDTPQAMHIAEIDNALVQGYEPSEWASIVRGRADAGMSVGEIASTFGFKRPSIAQQHLSLSYLPDSLLQAVDVGLLPQRVAVALGEGAQKYGIGPSTLQQLWLREIKPSPQEWTPTDVRTLFERIAPRAEVIEKQMGMFGELPGMEGQRDSLLTAMREMKSQVKELRLRKTRLAGVEREIYKDKRAGKAVSPRLTQAAGLLQQEIDAADAALRQIEQGQLDRVMAQAEGARPRPEARGEETERLASALETRARNDREALTRPQSDAQARMLRDRAERSERSARELREQMELRPQEARPTARMERPTFLTPEEARPVFGREGLPRRAPEAAPEAMRPMEVPPEEAARLAREAQEAAGQRRLGAPEPEAPPVRRPEAVAPSGQQTRRTQGLLDRVRRAGALGRAETEPLGRVGDYLLDAGLRSRFRDLLDVRVVFYRQLAETDATAEWHTRNDLAPPGPERVAADLSIRLTPQADEWALGEELVHAQQWLRGEWPRSTEEWYRLEDEARQEGQQIGRMLVGQPEPEAPGVRAPVTRPIPAEPAVPPPAGPVVPPVTAQPVPGARGIPGPPLAPGAGAAVGQGVLPGIGQPVTPPPQPPVVPPTGAPPPTTPMQPQFGTVGATPPGRWLPNLKNTDEILRQHYQPDWARRFTDWAERRSQVMARIMHFVGIPERSHAAKIRILWSEVVGDLYAAAEGAMARVRRLGSERALFDVVEGQAHIAGRAVAVGDVLEHIDDYPVSGVQRQYAETMHKIYDDAAALAEAEGIEVNKLSFADGGHYVGRRTMGRRLPDGTVVEAATITGGPTKRWVGGRAPFEKAREFATEQEALDAGYEYLDFADAQTANLRSLARRIANERVEQYILQNISARKGAKARLGEVALPGPAFRGNWFRPGDVKGVREYLEGTDYSIPRAAADVIRSLSRLPRMMLTAFDLGPAFIQLQAMGFSYPKQWAKAVAGGFEALLSERRYYEIMTQHADTITRWTPDGLIISRVGGTEWTEFVTRPGMLRKVPGLMRAARAPARMFDATLNFARVLGIEATEHLAKTDLERVELARFWNLFTGVVDPSRMGLTETQQAIEGAALFAPRYTRTVLAIFTDVVHGGLRGKMARESLAKVAVSGLATYIGLCAALNQKPELDPRKRGTWLTIGLAGQRVGIGGGFYSVTRLLGQFVTDPEKAPEYAANWLKGKLSPAVRSGMVALTKQDFLGRAVDTPWKLTKELIVGNFTPIWLQGTIEAGKDWRALTAVTAAEIVGLRTFPEAPATRRTNLREQFAQQQFGKAWADLHQGEKYELETTVPALAAVTEEARGLARERRTPWAMYRYDLEQMREPLRTEIANLTRQFEAGLMDGNQYREEIQTRQMMSARMGDFLRNVERYQGLEYAEQEPGNAVDRFIDSYYQVAEVLTDPRTGSADAGQIVRQRDWLMQETSPSVVSQGMRYINRNLDPKYIEARDLMREYQRIPQYIGMSDEQAQAANEAMRKYSAMRRANPLISTDVTRSLLAQQDPRAVILMEMAYSRRNPARRMFWAMHPLLSVFYSDLTEEEVEMVMPMQQMQQMQPMQQMQQMQPMQPMQQMQSQQANLPAWAMQGVGAGL